MSFHKGPASLYCTAIGNSSCSHRCCATAPAVLHLRRNHNELLQLVACQRISLVVCARLGCAKGPDSAASLHLTVQQLPRMSWPFTCFETNLLSQHSLPCINKSTSFVCWLMIDMQPQFCHRERSIRHLATAVTPLVILCRLSRTCQQHQWYHQACQQQQQHCRRFRRHYQQQGASTSLTPS